MNPALRRISEDNLNYIVDKEIYPEPVVSHPEYQKQIQNQRENRCSKNDLDHPVCIRRILLYRLGGKIKRIGQIGPGCGLHTIRIIN